MKKFVCLDQPYYLVTLSPWPVFMSIQVFNFFLSLLFWFSGSISFFWLSMNLFMLIVISFQWWRDLIRESMFQGFHVKKIINGLKLSMILFIISELFFFLSIFWCYFHMALSPSIELGSYWPPVNIIMMNPFHIPLLNSVILLSSGVFITFSHYSIMKGNFFFSKLMLWLTINLGLIFSFFQYIEYKNCFFSFNDSVFGSIFFFSTGFHGFHVIVGVLFLLVMWFRMIFNNFSCLHHLGFEFASWYWHFVDVVWLFLYIFVYYWFY